MRPFGKAKDMLGEPTRLSTGLSKTENGRTGRDEGPAWKAPELGPAIAQKGPQGQMIDTALVGHEEIHTLQKPMNETSCKI